MRKLNQEISLADLLADPMIGLMMKSDGVDSRRVERLFHAIGRDRAAPRRIAIIADPIHPAA